MFLKTITNTTISNILSFLFICLIIVNVNAQDMDIIPPGQSFEGPGSNEYVAADVIFSDFAKKADGYWLFEPTGTDLKEAHVIVFMHGYGCYNPMIYGQWIRHLVRKGNIVIYPRYQRNLLSPKPKYFARNAAKAINNALIEIQNGKHLIQPILSNIVYAGHSYGGTIIADLAVNYAHYGVPKPDGIFLVEPGTSRLKGGRLENYAHMPSDVKIINIAGSRDWVTGDEFALLVHQTAINTPKRVLLKQYPDNHGFVDLNATHHEPYCLDFAFDTGVRNYSAKRAISRAKLNTIDYQLYWRLLDALLDNTRSGKFENEIFGADSHWLRSLGSWSDGVAVKPLDVIRY